MTSVTIVGNIKIHASVLRKFLKKSHYCLIYDTKTNTARLSVNDGRGGEELITFENVDHAVIKKFAENLGLKADNEKEIPTFWSKWNPVLKLCDDGSEKVEELRLKMLGLGIPYYIVKSSRLGISDSGSFYDDSHDLESLIEKTATRYKEQLSTVP